ncbi:hypothetical protein ACWGJ2_17125 [Streptomyces sp. NPDC054796]
MRSATSATADGEDPAHGVPAPTVAPRPLGPGEIAGGVLAVIGRHWRPLYGVVTAVSAAAAVTATAVVAAADGWLRPSGPGAAALPAHAFWPDLGPGAGTGTGLDVGGGTGAGAGAGLPGSALAVGAALVPLLLLITACLMAVLHSAHGVALSAAATRLPLARGELWRRTRARLRAALGVQLLVRLCVGGTALAGCAAMAAVRSGAVPGVSAAPHGPAQCALTVLTGCVVPFALLALAFFVRVRLALAPAVTVLEGRAPLSALRRSWTLVRGSWWRVCGVCSTGAVTTVCGYGLFRYVAGPAGEEARTALLRLGVGGPSAAGAALTLTPVALALLLCSLAMLPLGCSALAFLSMDLSDEGRRAEPAVAGERAGPVPLRSR